MKPKNGAQILRNRCWHFHEVHQYYPSTQFKNCSFHTSLSNAWLMHTFQTEGTKGKDIDCDIQRLFITVMHMLACAYMNETKLTFLFSLLKLIQVGGFIFRSLSSLCSNVEYIKYSPQIDIHCACLVNLCHLSIPIDYTITLQSIFLFCFTLFLFLFCFCLFICLLFCFRGFWVFFFFFLFFFFLFWLRQLIWLKR